MTVPVDHVNLTKTELFPAYDMESSPQFFSFRADRIPGHYFATAKTVVVAYDTHQIDFFEEGDDFVRYTFKCTPEEHQQLKRLYWEQHPALT